MKTPSFTPSIDTISIFHDKSAVTFTTSLTPPTRILGRKRTSRKRVEWQGIFVLFTDGLPDDYGGVMRAKIEARDVFEAECKGMRRRDL